MKLKLKNDCNKFSREINSITDKRILEATIPAGTVVEVLFPDVKSTDKLFGRSFKDPTRMILTGQGILVNGQSAEISVRCDSKSWNKYFKANSKAPSMKILEKWMMDGVCKSLAGNTVELDGWSFDETPSWFLAMGLI